MKNIFSGLKMLDFTSNVAGPFPTALMADYGMEVIKVERPGVGDESRGYTPQIDGVSTAFCWNNRGKKSLVLDLRDPEAAEIVKKIVATCDIVMESNKPGTMEKYGIGYDVLKTVNPKLIMCSMSAFGQTGPLKNRPGYDVIVQAISGAMDMTGDPDGPPVKHGFAMGDYLSGTFAFGALATALYHRERTGEGQYIDLSLLDCMTSINGLVEIAALGLKPTRSGPHSKTMAPYGVYNGKGGSMVLVVQTPKAWATMCRLMKREDLIDDPRCITTGKRAENLDFVISTIEEWLKSFPNIEEPEALLLDADIPCTKIFSTSQLLENEQVLSRGMIIDLQLPDNCKSRRTVKGRNNPLKFSSAEPVLGKAPVIGQHQQEVLSSIGYTDDDIKRLNKKWGV